MQLQYINNTNYKHWVIYAILIIQTSCSKANLGDGLSSIRGLQHLENTDALKL